MSTAPRDQSALFWNAGGAKARQPQPGKELWRLTREGLALSCELRSRGALGAELQVLENGLLLHGRLYPSDALAVNAAGKQLAEALKAGWAR